jgi:hypothetical protein
MITDDVSRAETKHYPVKYSVWEYKFPTGDTIEAVRFDDTHIHLDLVDSRILSIPLDWIPPLRDASPAERAKFHITEDRDAVYWDPDESEVNELLVLADYLTTRESR